MSSHREEWTEAEWAARCRDGDSKAWDRLAELFVSRLHADVARCWRHRPPDAEQYIQDAVQDIFRNLRGKPEQVLSTFDGASESLAEFLTGLATRRAQTLCRGYRRLNRCEAEAAPTEEETPRHGEIDDEDRATRLEPGLTPREGDFLHMRLERRLSDACAVSSAVRWQLTHRMAVKQRKQDADDAKSPP